MSWTKQTDVGYGDLAWGSATWGSSKWGGEPAGSWTTVAKSVDNWTKIEKVD